MYLDRLTNFAVFLLFILFGGLALGNSPSLDPLADHAKSPWIVALVHFDHDFCTAILKLRRVELVPFGNAKLQVMIHRRAPA